MESQSIQNSGRAGEDAMSKYDKLWEYVRKQSLTIKLDYDEIEDIAGVPIDHSFLTYKKELTSYGWQVRKISMKERTVVFEKVDK